MPPTSKKIMLVDDDSFLIDMYGVKFTQVGDAIESFLNADEALAKLRTGYIPDAIVFDLVMPNKDGFGFLRSIKEEKLAPGAVLVALTNQGEDEERHKTEEMGAHEYIVKASTIPSEVVKKIHDAIVKHAVQP